MYHVYLRSNKNEYSYCGKHDLLGTPTINDSFQFDTDTKYIIEKVTYPCQYDYYHEIFSNGTIILKGFNKWLEDSYVF